MLKKGKWQTAEKEQTTRAVNQSSLVSGGPAEALADSYEGTGEMRVWHGYGSFIVVTIVYSSNWGLRAKLLSNYVGVERMAFGGAGI